MEQWTRVTFAWLKYWCRSQLVSRIEWEVWISISETFSIYSWNRPTGCSQVRNRNRMKIWLKCNTSDWSSIRTTGRLSSTGPSTSAWSLLYWLVTVSWNCQLRSSTGRTGMGGWREMLRSPPISRDRTQRVDPRRSTDSAAAAWENFLLLKSWWLLYWDCGLRVIFNKSDNSVLSPE